MRSFLTFSISFIFAFALLAITPVAAQEQDAILSSCVQIHNGGDTCYQSDTITINKKVLKPTIAVQNGRQLQDADFIENSTLSEPFTRANSLSAFRLYVTNISNRELKNITVTDILPERYLTYVTSDGTYDEQGRTTTFTIEALPAGETKAFTIQVMTAMGSLLPADPICVTNQAKATVTNERFFILPDETKESQDNARLCITQNEQGGSPLAANINTTKPASPTPSANPAIPGTTKGGLPVMSPTPTNQTPETGAEEVILFSLIPVGLAGFYLRRKTLHNTSL